MMGVWAMYRIDPDKNRIIEIPKHKFAELGFTERKHLQEWIAKEPNVFGEELLIIQKEFANFSGTGERLDLLALDKKGELVIIENKLDDSGKDVTWQALKYASYCSTLSEEEIGKIYQEYLGKNESGVPAEEKLSGFYGPDYKGISLNKSAAPRIILIAGDFRPEVTSTVLWLLNNFKVRLQCFKATAYSLDDELFLNVEQIIPIQDAEEFMIRMVDKAQNNRKSEANKECARMRRAFWAKLIEAMSKKTDLFKNTSPGDGDATWITAESSVDGLGFNFVVTQTYGRAELYIERGGWEESKRIFDELQKKKEQIESDFEGELKWEPLKSKRDCRITSEINGNVIKEDRWDDMIASMTKSMVKMEKVFSPLIKKIDEQLKNNPSKNK